MNAKPLLRRAGAFFMPFPKLMTVDAGRVADENQRPFLRFGERTPFEHTRTAHLRIFEFHKKSKILGIKSEI